MSRSRSYPKKSVKARKISMNDMDEEEKKANRLKPLSVGSNVLKKHVRSLSPDVVSLISSFIPVWNGQTYYEVTRKKYELWGPHQMLDYPCLNVINRRSFINFSKETEKSICFKSSKDKNLRWSKDDLPRKQDYGGTFPFHMICKNGVYYVRAFEVHLLRVACFYLVNDSDEGEETSAKILQKARANECATILNVSNRRPLKCIIIPSKKK